MENKNTKINTFFKPGDILVYLIIALFFGVLFYFFSIKKESGAYGIEVLINNRIAYYYKVSLESKKIEIEAPLGKCILETDKKKVRLIEVSCSNKLCRKQGWISKSGEMLICVPNKMVIRLTGKEEIDEVVK